MSRRKNPGAGVVPAPRGSDDQAAAVAAELRAELREARGALNDLVRERKAVEQMARDHADRLIEAHVNACLAELTRHVDAQLVSITEQVHRYLKNLLEAVGADTEPPKPPKPAELLQAYGVVRRAEKIMKQREGDGRG